MTCVFPWTPVCAHE